MLAEFKNDFFASHNDMGSALRYLSVQRAINSGMWGLQGSYGRTMMQAIENGQCMLGANSARDYYGNRIPSRTEVQQGTKGSYDFVLAAMGEEWANEMAGA
jgi:hypothetical protein